ncbi:MAG: 3'-5' exoribonuclease YhaM family protein [bacterium]
MQETPVKRQYTSQLRLGDQVDDFFVLTEAVLRPLKTGDRFFLRCNLRDRFGSVPAVMWEGAEGLYPTLRGNPVVKVRGNVNSYNGALQVVLDGITLCQERLDPGYFLPVSTRPRQEMERELVSAVAEVRSEPLSWLLKTFFADPEFCARFSQAPAGKSIHHAYVGGLLEHTLETVHFARAIAVCYPNYINKDLLLTGALLHDCGKIHEYCVDGMAFGLTDEGRLFGHLVLGSRMVEEKLREKPDFPLSLQRELLHMILSHHGKEEWGSPQPPKTFNAFALHHADYLSAELNHFHSLVVHAEANRELWTATDRKLERSVYLGFLGDDEVAAVEERRDD